MTAKQTESNEHKKMRWGILGPGNIARSFVEALQVIEGATLHAVASASSPERAQAFADKHGAARAYGSYAELLADPDVDAVYVATLNHQHLPATLQSLKAGKPTLCEKPIAVNLAEAEKMCATAKEQGVFLMEAMWTRFLPAIRKARAWIDEGRIGETRIVRASFGFKAGPVDPESRMFNPHLAAGAYLDVGIYPLSFAQHFMGENPLAVKASAHLGETGVDEQSALLCEYSGGRFALLDAAVRTLTEHAASVEGTLGRIRIVPKFWRASRIQLVAPGDKIVDEFEAPFRASGFEYEIEEVMRCVEAGLIESPIMPHAESLGNMRVLDEARRQVGLKYPFE